MDYVNEALSKLSQWLPAKSPSPNPQDSSASAQAPAKSNWGAPASSRWGAPNQAHSGNTVPRLPSSNNYSTSNSCSVSASSAVVCCGDMALFVRLAGLSGALAVGLSAYGAHVMRDSAIDPRRKMAFDTGNRYHLMHTVALLASNHSTHPRLTATLFLAGMMLFSGSCYHFGVTGKEQLRQLAPYGGMVLIAAWLSFLL